MSNYERDKGADRAARGKNSPHSILDEFAWPDGGKAERERGYREEKRAQAIAEERRKKEEDESTKSTSSSFDYDIGLIGFLGAVAVVDAGFCVNTKMLIGRLTMCSKKLATRVAFITFITLFVVVSTGCGPSQIRQNPNTTKLQVTKPRPGEDFHAYNARAKKQTDAYGAALRECARGQSDIMYGGAGTNTGIAAGTVGGLAAAAGAGVLYTAGAVLAPAGALLMKHNAEQDAQAGVTHYETCKAEADAKYSEP